MNGPTAPPRVDGSARERRGCSSVAYRREENPLASQASSALPMEKWGRSSVRRLKLRSSIRATRAAGPAFLDSCLAHRLPERLHLEAIFPGRVVLLLQEVHHVGQERALRVHQGSQG